MAMTNKHLSFIILPALLGLSPMFAPNALAQNHPMALPLPAGVSREVLPLTQGGPPVRRQSCDEQVQECLDGCNGISPRQSGDIPACLSTCGQINDACRDR